MNFSQKGILAITLVFVSVVYGSEQRVWTYYAKDRPKDGATCEELGKNLSLKITTSMNVPIFDVQAEDTGDSCQLAVTYVRQWPIPVVSTHFDIQPIDLRPSWGTWNYHSLQECEKVLPAQSALFQAETGLPPLYAYCPKWHGIDPQSPVYMLKIDGLGDAQTLPQLFAAPAMRTERQLTFDNAVRNEIARSGARLFHYAYSQEDGSAFHFYANPSQMLPVRKFLFDGYHDQTECESQLPEAAAIVKSFGNRILATGCSARRAGGLSQLHVLFALTGNSGLPRKREISEVEYPDVETCNAKKREFQNHYASVYGWRIVGSLCRSKGIFEDAVTPVLFTFD